MTKVFCLSDIKNILSDKSIRAIRFLLLCALGKESKQEIEDLFQANNCIINNLEGDINNIKFKIEIESDKKSILFLKPLNLTGIYNLGVFQEMLEHLKRAGLKIGKNSFSFIKINQDLEIEVLEQ